MSDESDLIEKLTALNHIVETLNRAVDVRGVLNDALADLVRLMGLETGWIFVRDSEPPGIWGENGYVLSAYHNLPPALDLDNAEAWERGCDCQDLCNRERLTKAHNEVLCGRLTKVSGDRRGLAMHASAPLRSGDRTLGILNVAAPDWSSFTPQSLALLTNVGNQIGVALERAQLFDLLREQRIREQAALLKLSHQLLSRLDLSDLIGYLVEEVQHILQADACALLLPGDEPGYLDFRAASGWHADPVSAGWRVPADGQSGPGLAMRTQHPFLVEDIVERDPAPWLPNWLAEEGFRGHAVMPLIAGGHSVGALVIDTRKPRPWDEDEVRLLSLMGNQAAIAIEKARLHQEEVKKQGLEKEMALGQQIQLSLLPKNPPTVPGWEFAVYYQAARLVGGDFYDFYELPGEPGQLGLLVADVVGKGVPAAMFMALSRTTIRTVALSGGSPAAVLERANDLILKDSYSDFFLTAFYAVLDTHTGHLVYANGGHNWPLWLQATTGEFQEWSAQSMLLGSFDWMQLDECEIGVAPGDLLIFYTDGVTEAMNADYQLFGEERFRAAVAARAEAGAQQILDSVVDAIKAHTGDMPQSDDVTLVVVKRHPLS